MLRGMNCSLNEGRIGLISNHRTQQLSSSDTQVLSLTRKYQCSILKEMHKFSQTAADYISLYLDISSNESVLHILLKYQQALKGLPATVMDKLTQLSINASSNMRLLLSELRSELDDISNGIHQSISGMTSLSKPSDEKTLELIAQIDDDLSDISRIWWLLEVTNFYDSPMLGMQFICYLRGDEVDLVVLDCISAWLSDIVSNPLPDTITTMDYEISLKQAASKSFEEVLMWLAIRGHHELLWNLIINHPIVLRIVDESQSGKNVQSTEYAEGLGIIEDILNSHPYMHYFLDINQSNIDEDISSLPAKLQSYQRKVSNFLSSNHSVMGKLTFISRILHIISGAIEVMESCCQSWVTLVLGKLLYQNSPPLGSSDLSYIIESCFQSIKSRRAISGLEERHYQHIINALNGRVSYLLSQLYGISRSESIIESDTKLLGLTTAANLSLILAMLLTEEKKDLITTMPIFSNECCFVEELYLEVAEVSSFAGYTSEMICGYLKMCPSKGPYFVSALLQKHQFSSDRDAFQLSKLFSNMDLLKDASCISMERGQLWMRRSAAFCLCFSSSDITPSLSRISLAKAVYFFQKADAQDYLRLCIEIAFIRLAYAVRRSPSFFPNMRVNPYKISSPLLSDSLSTSERIQLSTMNDVFLNEEFCIQELNDALGDALGVLTTLLPKYFSEKSQLRGDVLVLELYTRAISLRIKSKEWEDLEEASSNVANLLLGGFLPLRHSLHVLELVASIHSTAQANLSTEEEVDIKEESLEKKKRKFCTFKKDDCFGFLASLLQVTSSVYSSRFCNGCSDDDINTLRNRLLDALSFSILQENADSTITGHVSDTQEHQQKKSVRVDKNITEELQSYAQYVDMLAGALSIL